MKRYYSIMQVGNGFAVSYRSTRNGKPFGRAFTFFGPLKVLVSGLVPYTYWGFATYAEAETAVQAFQPTATCARPTRPESK